MLKIDASRQVHVTVGNIIVENLDEESFKIFRREALRSKRVIEAELNISNEEPLSKLTVRLNHAIADGYLVANVFRLLEQEIKREKK